LTSAIVDGPLFRAVDRIGRVGAGVSPRIVVGEGDEDRPAQRLRDVGVRANKSEAAIMRQGR